MHSGEVMASVSTDLRQVPETVEYLLLHRGDVVEFALTIPADRKGRGFLRTNIGNAEVRWTEIVRHVEEGKPILSQDWHDIAMQQVGERLYSLTLPLAEVGRFEAKACFLPEGSDEPVWPEGGNTVIKVAPADYCCANNIYTAFVRQFGPNKFEWSASDQKQIDKLERDGYSVIPRSGTFRDLIKELDFIIGRLRFRIIQLLPIFPTPTTYGRMGKFGSPFAALDFMDVDPALAQFDRGTTPMGQFTELVEAIHHRNARLFLDIPINHTGWASKLQIERPEWFVRDKESKFKSPGAWGVTWEDLAKLDYRHPDLWKYMADVFLFWCQQGVDGFRCDAGYMISSEAWEYIVAKVRLEYPDTIFMLEGLGGSIDTLKNLLTGANLDWAYSELFQNYDRRQIASYLPDAIDISSTKGVLVHFAETHDNVRLASTSRTYARLRTALSALCSQEGAFGITNGVEWFAEDKIDVHGAPPLKWENAKNQVADIARLNAILETHTCFHPGAKLALIQEGASNTVVLARTSADGNDSLLVIANLSHQQRNEAHWRREKGLSKTDMVDLITGKHVPIQVEREECRCLLEPGQVLCLSPDGSALDLITTALDHPLSMPERTRRQCLKAKALEVYGFYHPCHDVSGINVANLAEDMSKDPRAFCDIFTESGPAPVVTWNWPRDAKRIVMIPPKHFLYVKSEHPFSATLRCGGKVLRYERSIRRNDGRHFALIRSPDEPAESFRCFLDLAVDEPEETRRLRGSLLYLPSGEKYLVRTSFNKEEVLQRDCYVLCTNGCGAMSQARGVWGKIKSQYDALLAANLHPNYPVDRRIMLTRCRAWLVCRGYSQAIDEHCLQSFSVGSDGHAVWHFIVPAGQGMIVSLIICLKMIDGENAVTIDFGRRNRGSGSNDLDDHVPVKLIIRPDVEDRLNHEKTKAYAGPETSWPQSLLCDKRGFGFAPSDSHRLVIHIANGIFTSEPEWTYMVPHLVDAERGLGDCSDLFSPGYFTAILKGGDMAIVRAEIIQGKNKRTTCSQPDCSLPGRAGRNPSADMQQLQTFQAENPPMEQALRTAMRQFIVKRENSKTVIAGYPWFLDWGRDTLICLRGMIAAGMFCEARDILRQFGRFESQGTLPNMIRGDDDTNRDTSDAPLWFFVACRDLVNADCGYSFAKATKDRLRSAEFLEFDCGGRTVKEILLSIANNYIEGTPNGIRMDPQSGLIFSPSHFTWMDTNHPAGTPREGYPIEVQTLWHFALKFLAELDEKGRWLELANKVRNSIRGHFAIEGQPAFLSDCLHAKCGQPAKEAVADDHLRPNQLLAITLGAIEDKSLCAGILVSCEDLLVPGAIRSLADRQVKFQLPVIYQGRLLNDPARPYWGQYRGDEETQRKPAYHNGSAWTWLFPSYCEALSMTYGEDAKATALAILSGSTELIDRGCIGHIPEIVDGDAPHKLRGCGAQAWGATELYRVLAILTKN